MKLERMRRPGDNGRVEAEEQTAEGSGESAFYKEIDGTAFWGAHVVMARVNGWAVVVDVITALLIAATPPDRVIPSEA